MRIESLGVYHPPKTMTTSEAIAGCRVKTRMPLETLTGIRSRHVAENENSIDLAAKAARDCLQRSRYEPSAVALIISCSTSRSTGSGFECSTEPSAALLLKKVLGLDNAIAFDLGNACAGMFTAAWIAESFLRSTGARAALIVSGEHLTPVMLTAQKEIESAIDKRMACLTIGDAGAAALLDLSDEPGVGFEAIDVYTMSEHCQLSVAYPSKETHGGVVMFTDSMQATVNGLAHGVSHFSNVLARHAWPVERIEHMIMHQASRSTLRSAVDELNRRHGRAVCTNEVMIDNLATRANGASTSHFVAIADATDAGRIKPRDRLALGVSGSGLTIGAALYRASGNERATSPKETSSDLPIGWHGGGASVQALTTSDKDRETMAMAVDAGRAALAKAALDPSAIELLIFCGRFRSGFLLEPAFATHLAAALGLNASATADSATRTFAFDVDAGARGTAHAAAIAAQAIAQGQIRHAMIVSAEAEPNAVAPFTGVTPMAQALILGKDAALYRVNGFFFRDALALADDVRSFITASANGAVVEIVLQPGWRERLLAAAGTISKEAMVAHGAPFDSVVAPPIEDSGDLSTTSWGVSLPLLPATAKEILLVDAARGGQVSCTWLTRES